VPTLLDVEGEDHSHSTGIQHGLEALETELIKVEVNVHNVDLILGRIHVLLLKHLLRFNKAAQAEANLLLGHFHTL
jgi:hypothetical protein